MPVRNILYYNPKLKEYARELRNNSTKSEMRLWKYLKGKQLGYDFHRQKPIDQYILDFFCHDLMLGIELDGFTHKYFNEIVKKDAWKDERLKQIGITVLRFDDNEVMKELNSVIANIQSFIEEHEQKTNRNSII
jgi:very-short-patch-repair endonuclease